jgi:hypothetical protein
MNFDGLNSEGDLPPDHPLVLQALKGIISGPISEFRSTVDNLITNPSNALKKSHLDYQNLLPAANNPPPQNVDHNLQMANNILTRVIDHTVIKHNEAAPQEPLAVLSTPQDPNQPELPLFKPTEISDIYKKLFDIEGKIDTLIRYVKGSKVKKQD